MDAKTAFELIKLLDVDAQVRKSEIHQLDNFYSKGRESHYYSVGFEALWNVIYSMLGVGMTHVNYILDFPSGFGRVTRYLHAAFPNIEIHVGDRWEEAADYCVTLFQAKKLEVRQDLPTMLENRYDIIFSGTFLTHLPEEKGAELIDFLTAHLNIHGILIISSCGRKSLLNEQVHFNAQVFGKPENLATLTRKYLSGHYAFINYPGQLYYGRSFIPLSWFHNHIMTRPHLIITRFTERGWDDSLDVLTIKRIA